MVLAAGCVESTVAKAFYLCFGPDGELEGLVGTHVDDDITTGSSWFEANVQTLLDATFSYGAEQRDNVEHTGYQITRHADTGLVELSQSPYCAQLSKIAITKERALQLDSYVTEAERSALRAGNGKANWLHRNSRIDLGFDLAV